MIVILRSDNLTSRVQLYATLSKLNWKYLVIFQQKECIWTQTWLETHVSPNCTGIYLFVRYTYYNIVLAFVIIDIGTGWGQDDYLFFTKEKYLVAFRRHVHSLNFLCLKLVEIFLLDI